MKLSNFYTYTIGNPTLTRGEWVDLTNNVPTDNSDYEWTVPEDGILICTKAVADSAAGGVLDKNNILVAWINSQPNSQSSCFYVLKGEKYKLRRNENSVKIRFQKFN